MSKSPQKDAVYNTLMEVFHSKGIKFTPGHTDARQLVDKSIRQEIIQSLVSQFENGEIPLSSRQNNLKEYVSGLVSNWLRKDKRLNGGVTHTVSNPGSRKGQQDPLIKNLRILQSTLEPGSMEYQAAQDRINNRLMEIKQEHMPKVDRDALPEEFKRYVK